MSSAVHHVFFDFDGVLCDSLDDCIVEYELLRRTRFPSLPAVPRDGRMDVPFSGLLKTALHEWLDEDEARAFFDAHSSAMRQHAMHLQPFPGVSDLLASLADGRASIVSSAYNAAICSVLADSSGAMPPAIKHLLGRDSRESKTEKIKHVLHSEHLEPDQAIYVGDLESDLLYCRSVPMDCILVTYGYHSADYLRVAAPGAFAFVDSVENLRSVLVELMDDVA